MNYSTEFVESEPNVSQWLLADGLNGPAIAVMGTIEFLLSLPLNLFIVFHAVCHSRECTNRSSTFLLLILAITNLLQVILYMPFWIIASGAEEWLFGSTDSVRSVLCQIHGFLFVALTFASLHALAVISFDRFLSIVNPHLHKKFMSCKVSLAILAVLLVFDVLLNLGPYYSRIMNAYVWAPDIGGCVSAYGAFNNRLVWFHVAQSIIPLCIIAITSVWTFAFTRGFLKKNLMSQKTFMSDERFVEQQHIYTVQIKNLVGIFGSLTIFTALSWVPYYFILAVGLGVGFESIPSLVYIISFILFLFSNVSNPIIQIYFRKDLIDSLKKVANKCKIDRIKARRPSWTVRWQNRNTNSSTTTALDDDINKQVKITNDSSNALIKGRKLDSKEASPNTMADGTVDLMAPAGDELMDHLSSRS